MKYFSMFSGIGGFENGIERATKGKWKCVGFSEIDKYAIQTYKKHFPNHKNYGDATKINPKELPDFDMLCGGFPCQSFSIAGKRMGFEDTRGTLFFDIARIVKVKRPQYLFLENVKGLLNHDNGRTFTTILTTLDELGYNAEWQVLNSKHFGVPQNRERVFIIGHLRGTSGQEIFPIRKGSSKNIKTHIKDKFQKTVYNINGISPTVREGHGDVIRIIQLNKPKHSTDRLYSTKGISRTIRSSAGGLGAKTGSYKTKLGIRKLTPIECERLQGFPDNWSIGSDSQRYKQLGNAVTVNVIEEIIKKWNQN